MISRFLFFHHPKKLPSWDCVCVCACLCACLPLEIQNCSLYSWNVPIVATKSGTCFLNRKHQETLRPTKPGCTCNVKRLDAFLWVLSLIMILCLIIDSDSGAPQSTNLHGCRNMPKGSQKWWVYGCGIRMPWFCTTRRSSWGLNFSYFDFIIFSIFLDMLEPYRFQTIPTSKQVAPIVHVGERFRAAADNPLLRNERARTPPIAGEESNINVVFSWFQIKDRTDQDGVGIAWHPRKHTSPKANSNARVWWKHVDSPLQFSRAERL